MDEKQTITLVLNKDTIQEEIKNLRKKYNDKGYRVVIFISGDEDYKSNIRELIRSGV